MIDQNARNKLFTIQREKALIDGLGEKINGSKSPPAATISLPIGSISLSDDQVKMVVDAIKNKVIDIPPAPKPPVDPYPKAILTAINSLQVSVQRLNKSITKVEVTNPPPPPSPVDLSPLSRSLDELKQEIVVILRDNNKNDVTAPAQENQTSAMILDSLVEIHQSLERLNNKEINFPKSIELSNFRQWIPTPVTNFNINPLRGVIHTTSATVTTALTVLPTYGVLANRRSVSLYNNSSSVTIYIGGSDVTATNGLPVPPLSYSPAFDFGTKMILYGVTSSSSADVRVMELSNDRAGP